jgi:hypothetical protein
VSRDKSKIKLVATFVRQLFGAAAIVAVLWFASVGLSRTAIANLLGGNVPPSKEKIVHAVAGKFPKGFVAKPGATYHPGKNGGARVLVHSGQGRDRLLINWPARTNALHIVVLVVLFALVIVAIDRMIRLARRLTI